MPQSVQGMAALLSVIAVLLLVSSALILTSATTIVQPQPNTVSSGDKLLVSANMARNASAVALSYYADSNKNSKDDDGAWVKIANVTDGGAFDADNSTNGFILFSWMTPQLPPGQYILKVEDPFGPTRTTVLTVQNAQLQLIPTIYGPNIKTDKGLIKPGDTFSVSTEATGNCRLCHTTDNPTTQNPGVAEQKIKKAFSADLSQITGNPGDTAVAPDYVHHLLVQWMPVASKTLADNKTVSVTVIGTNPAGNLTTQSTAFAGVNKAVNIPPTNKAVNIPPTSTNQNTNGSSASATAAQSSGSTSNPLPGFEALFAVAGLTFVAYLVNRRR